MRPALALARVGGEIVRQQSGTEHAVDVHRLAALAQQPQAELGVLADAVLGPAQPPQVGGAHQRHRAVLHDGVALVAMVHADAEEALGLPVHHAVEGPWRFQPVRLRGLDHAHRRVLEMGPNLQEPARVDHVVGVHHRHPARLGVGHGQRLVQRTGLETGQSLPLREAQPRVASLRHPGSQRLARLRVGGVVVDDDHLEGRPLERQQRVHRLRHHRRRLVGTGQVDADERRRRGPERACGLGGAHFGPWCLPGRHGGPGPPGRRCRAPCRARRRPFGRPEALGELEGLGQQRGADEAERGHHQHQPGHVDGPQVVRQRNRQQQHAQRDDGLHRGAEGKAPGRAQAWGGQQPGQHGQRADRAGHGRLAPAVGVGRHRAVQRELGAAPGVPQPPVGARAPLGGDLPGLVEGFDQVVVQPPGVRLLQEAAHEQRLVRRRGAGQPERRAVAGPADLGHHHRAVGKAGLHPRDLVQGGLHRLVDAGLLPVGQDVDGDEVHVPGQLGLGQPDMPGLGVGDLHRGAAQRPAHLVQVGAQPVRRQLRLELGLVADDQAVHVGVGARHIK